MIPITLPDSPSMRRMRRRLEQLELAHLRQHCSDLAQRLEDSQAQLHQAQQDRAFAESYAAMHEREAELLRESQDDPEFSTHRSIGLTRDGELMVVAN